MVDLVLTSSLSCIVILLGLRGIVRNSSTLFWIREVFQFSFSSDHFPDLFPIFHLPTPEIFTCYVISIGLSMNYIILTSLGNGC